MGNQTSQTNSIQQFSSLKNYSQVSRTNDGVIYKSQTSSSQQSTPEYYLLKQHNYHNQQTYQQAYKKYQLSLSNNQQSTSNTLAIKQVLKQQIQHFCSNTFKIYTLYEFPQLTLKDQIQVRSKQNKYFEECQILAILQTCLLALEQIKTIISFTPKYIFISPDGVIKVIHSDLVDQNYRHVITPNTYYAPQKITNFLHQNSSEIPLQKQIIFSMGMTLLQACLLYQIYNIYNYDQLTVNQQKLYSQIQSITPRYSSQLIQLLSNMLQINPNRRISILQIQRSLNKFDDNFNQQETANQQDGNLQKQLKQKQIYSKQDLENKCSKFFSNDASTLPRIKQSNQSIQQPSVPNLISHQNSSRISLNNVNYNSNKNASNQFCNHVQNSLESYKLAAHHLPINSNTQPNYMTAHFPQTNQTNQIKSSSNDHIFTDPKLLQMIRKDLQQINYSRTSRILTNDQMNSSWVNTSQNNIQNSITNRFKTNQQYRPQQVPFTQSSYNLYTNHKTFTEFTTLNNCPQVQSLAASIAMDYSNQKRNYQYEESQVKRHPQDRTNSQSNQKMNVSVALSTKNFNTNPAPNNTKNYTKNLNNQVNESSTVRYPLKQVNININPASSLSQVQSQIKAAMMKKKESNLIYLQEIYQDGVKYEGMSKDGLKQGYGKLIYNDGAYYEGYFHNDKINGKGILYYKKNHPAYDGQWLDQQFNGYGQLYNQQPQQLDEQFPYHNWNFLQNYWIKYEGQFLNDNKHGHGKMILTTDEFVQGEFIQDMLNGWAKFYKQNGDYIEGRWQNNILVELKNE